jgi:hypothetical protein
MYDTVQTCFRALIDFGCMKLYVLLPNEDGALPELQLAMESNDCDALRQLANQLAKEIREVDDPELLWSQAAGASEEQLLVHGHCCFLIRA